MNKRLFISAALLATVTIGLPAFAVAQEDDGTIAVRSDVPFVTGFYTKKEDCDRLKGWGDSGRADSLTSSVWHLGPKGFADGWEGACTFHTAFVKDRTAIVHSVCQEGATTALQTYYLEKEEGDTAPITVISGNRPEEDSGEGEYFEYCTPLPTP